MERDRLILPGDPGFLTPEKVNQLHAYDDVDRSAVAHHHTLGLGANQAAPGNHIHKLPVAWYRTEVAMTIPASAWTRINLATKIHLSSNHFSFDAVNNQIVVKKSGLYLVMGRVAFELGGGGTRYFRLRFGNYDGIGISWLGRVNDTATADSNELSDTGYIDLQSGQFIALDAFSTAATTTRASATIDERMYSQLQVIRLNEWLGDNV